MKTVKIISLLSIISLLFFVGLSILGSGNLYTSDNTNNQRDTMELAPFNVKVLSDKYNIVHSGSIKVEIKKKNKKVVYDIPHVILMKFTGNRNWAWSKYYTFTKHTFRVVNLCEGVPKLKIKKANFINDYKKNKSNGQWVFEFEIDTDTILNKKDTTFSFFNDSSFYHDYNINTCYTRRKDEIIDMYIDEDKIRVIEGNKIIEEVIIKGTPEVECKFMLN